MLAALQESFSTPSLDASAASFGADSYVSMGFVGADGAQDDNLANVGGMFGDYGASGPFDVGTFTPQDLGLSADGSSVHTPSEHSASPDHKGSVIKDESAS